jgi:hypothetical protein
VKYDMMKWGVESRIAWPVKKFNDAVVLLLQAGHYEAGHPCLSPALHFIPGQEKPVAEWQKLNLKIATRS